MRSEILTAVSTALAFCLDTKKQERGRTCPQRKSGSCSKKKSVFRRYETTRCPAKSILINNYTFTAQ